MPTTDENVRKVIDLTVKTEHLTEDVLKNCMQEFLSHTSEKKGKMSVGELCEAESDADALLIHRDRSQRDSACGMRKNASTWQTDREKK